MILPDFEETSAARAAAAGDPSLEITNMRSQNHEKNSHYSEVTLATVKLANTGPGAAQGDNLALRAIQRGQSPQMPTAPKVAVSVGVGDDTT